MLNVLNDLIARPEQLRCPLCEKVLPVEVTLLRQELDDLLRPVFRFTDKGEARAVTIPDLAFNIVDKVLHATFTLAFRDSIEEPEAPPLMEELETRLKTNERM